VELATLELGGFQDHFEGGFWLIPPHHYLLTLAKFWLFVKC